MSVLLVSFIGISELVEVAFKTLQCKNIKMKKGKNSWRDLIVNKSFDLFIVIVGLTIAFELNNLKEDYDDRFLEKFYLESMLSDLDKDLLEYGENLKELKADHKLTTSCLQRFKSLSSSDSLGFTALNIMANKTFEGHRNTYSTVLNSNGLTLIADAEIRNLILDHYRLYAAIERFEAVYSNVILRVQDHFITYIDYNSLGHLADRRGIESIETNNVLTLAAIQLQSGIWKYEESIEKAEALKARIRTYLDN